jgi:hypothetical protein
MTNDVDQLQDAVKSRYEAKSRSRGAWSSRDTDELIDMDRRLVVIRSKLEGMKIMNKESVNEDLIHGRETHAVQLFSDMAKLQMRFWQDAMSMAMAQDDLVQAMSANMALDYADPVNETPGVFVEDLTSVPALVPDFDPFSSNRIVDDLICYDVQEAKMLEYHEDSIKSAQMVKSQNGKPISPFDELMNVATTNQQKNKADDLFRCLDPLYRP